MKLKFSDDLEYQLEAIGATLDLLEGAASAQSSFEVSTPGRGALAFTELGVGNALELSYAQLFENLRVVQERNLLSPSASLIQPETGYSFPNYSVEMETGTGKTYVYLRTIFELNQKYGLKKFIIVVPSVAIREGVMTSIDLMREHFMRLYDNVAFSHFVYHSKDLSKVRQFAAENTVQIMIINIQAFQKDAGDVADYSRLDAAALKKLNIIHKELDGMSGRRPIEFVRAAKPVLIIDEPQSVDTTAKAKRSIGTLNPLFALRYSATHKDAYNLIYKLDPIQAYDLGLVKQIEVTSIRSEGNFNETFLRVERIGYVGQAKSPSAKVTVHEDTPNGPKEKRVTLKLGTDLSEQTNRAGYGGYIVTEISAEPGLESVTFANGKRYTPAQEEGGMADEMLKAQIYQTVEEHFKKEKRLRGKGIKVLSLFFVDKVANYRYYDDAGRPQKGKLARWFEEAFREVSARPLYKGLLNYELEALHDGYFAEDKKRGQVVSLKDTSGSTKADDEVYQLIMKDKEKLLSEEEPLRFIFSHSALKEGWDNPNVFQICSLRELGTERERRQVLGRGLRLSVSSTGERVYDESINKLSVIANESFEDYAQGLQTELERDIGGGFKFGRLEKNAFARLVTPDDAGDEALVGQAGSAAIFEALVQGGYLNQAGDITAAFTPEVAGFRLELPEYSALSAAITDEMKRYLFKNRVVDGRTKRTLSYNKRVELNEEFRALWTKISQKTRYAVNFETSELIELAAQKIRQMEFVKPVEMKIDKTELDVSVAGVGGGRVLSSGVQRIKNTKLPDILAYLQRESELTRGTLVAILKASGRLKDFPVNPQAFMTEVAKLVKRSLNELVVDGIKYEKVTQAYEMRLFEEREIDAYLNTLYEVKSADDRTPYNYVPWDSTVEKEIAEKLDTDENVKFFCKLPNWFKIPTPIGSYNPDWAVATVHDSKLYLVRETKSTHDRDKRRESENKKIDCGRAHFEALGADFKVANTIYEVLS